MRLHRENPINTQYCLSVPGSVAVLAVGHSCIFSLVSGKEGMGRKKWGRKWGWKEWEGRRMDEHSTDFEEETNVNYP